MGFAARMLMTLVTRMKGMGWLEWAGVASLIDTVLTYNVKKEMFAIVVEYAAKGAGLNLDPEDPFSDASLSAAVSERVGFTIRTLKDKKSIEEDVENYALLLIQNATGYKLSSLRNAKKLKEDLSRAALQTLSADIGIPLALPEEGELDKVEVKKQILAWAKPQLMDELNAEACYHTAEIVNAAGLEAVASDLNSQLSEIGSKQTVTARQIALKVSEKIAVGAVVEFGKVAVSLDRKSRKRERGRASQARFRAAHGARQMYVPLGFVGSVEEQAGPPVIPE